MADVSIYSCTGSSLLFFSRPDRRVLRFRTQQQLAYVREFCCQVTSTLCRAMPRTLQVSCPNPASCGRPNALGPHCTCVASRSLVMELSMLHFAGSALCLAGLCPSFVTVLPRQPTGPGSNLRQRCQGGCHWVCIETRFSQYEPCTVFTIVHASPLPSTQVVPASR